MEIIDDICLKVKNRLQAEFRRCSIQDIADAVAEARELLLCRLNNGKVIENIFGFIYKKAKRKLIDKTRHDSRFQCCELSDETGEKYSFVEYCEECKANEWEEMLEELKKIIPTLKPEDRLIIELHYEKKMPLTEMSKILGCSRESLWKKHERIKNDIREKMGIKLR